MSVSIPLFIMFLYLLFQIKLIQECIPVGCVPSAAVAVSPGGGVCSQGDRLGGCLLWGGVCSQGCLPPGGSAPGGVSAPGFCSRGGIPACTEADPLPCGQIHACKNITFATSLQTVIMHTVDTVKHKMTLVDIVIAMETRPPSPQKNKS